MDKGLLKGSIDILILSLISQGDMYGYDIARSIKEKSQNLYEMGEGTLYTALKRLENNGLLQSYWGDSEGGGRRRYYTITDKGRRELVAKLNAWQQLDHLIKTCLEGGS